MRGHATMGIGRRGWLLGLGASWLASRARADGPRDLDPEADLEAIEERGRKAGLAAFRSVESPQYRVVGDAPEAHLKLLLGDCRAVSDDFFAYYQAQGFEVKRPGGRLTAVAFANLRSYAAFLGTKPDLANGGRYDRVSNRLYVFDYRPVGNINLRAGHANLIFLAHEATHQLAFNSGLLDRSGDVPRSIAEGIALYGEIRKPDGPSPPGRLNTMRLTDLAHKQRQGTPWVPLPRLIAEDGPINGSAGFDAMLLAYAQSWLLVYHLMKEPGLLEKFRDYLTAICPRRDPKGRLDDARAHLGDLDRLDKDLRRLSIGLLKANSN